MDTVDIEANTYHEERGDRHSQTTHRHREADWEDKLLTLWTAEYVPS